MTSAALSLAALLALGGAAAGDDDYAAGVAALKNKDAKTAAAALAR